MTKESSEEQKLSVSESDELILVSKYLSKLRKCDARSRSV